MELHQSPSNQLRLQAIAPLQPVSMSAFMRRAAIHK